MTALRVFNWLRLGPGVYHWSALDALAYATGPDPWINNPTDWIGLWKLFNWFGGEVLLLAAAALVAIAGLSPLAHVDEIDAKIKARLAQKAPPPVG
jgi:hypothetical protein